MAAKRFYPAFLDLTGRLVVIIGPGESLLRKAKQLSRYDADVLAITPEPSPDLLQAEAEGLFGIERRSYVRGDLAGAALVICLNADEEVQRAVSDEAKQVGCPVNVTGALHKSTFIAPSVIHREPLQIAVSTGGVAPQLAKYLRKKLAADFGDEWAAFSELFAEVRAIALDSLEEPDSVESVLDAVLQSDTLARIRAGEVISPDDVFARFAPEMPQAEDDSSAEEHDGSPSAEKGSETAAD